jgi:hypothetical protein
MPIPVGGGNGVRAPFQQQPFQTVDMRGHFGPLSKSYLLGDPVQRHGADKDRDCRCYDGRRTGRAACRFGR